MNMRKIVVLLLGLVLMVSTQMIASDQYAVSLHVGYGHNLTYGSMANFDLGAYMPINQHFDMHANLRMSTANTYTVGLQMRPKFALPVGQFYLEDRMMANFVKRDNYQDFVHALSLGYMMQYINVQVGMYSRVFVPQPYEWRSDDEMICEPFNLLYRVEAYVRPETSLWNISLAVANVDDFQMERMWQPMAYIGAWYDINNHWRVQLTGKYKLAGMFHLNAHYYASDVRVGATYKL
jgi:hypothetical protein